MSVKALTCPKCQRECQFERIAPMPVNRQLAYGVSWVCGTCNKRYVDVCNLGPFAPAKSNCLNCGEDYDSRGKCPGCGLTLEETEAFLQIPSNVDRSTLRDAAEGFRQGLHRHSLGLLNRLLQQDPSIVEAWLLKYRFYYALGLEDAIQQMYKGAIERGAPSDLALQHGRMLAAVGVHDCAVDLYQRYIYMMPQSPKLLATAHSEQGNSYAELGDYPKAEMAHQQAISIMPALASLYLNYADTLITQRRWNEALQTLDIGINYANEAEERAALLEAKAHVCAAQQRGEDALKLIDAALDLGNTSLRAYYIRGQALALLGRLKEARQAMAIVLELDPNSLDGQRAMKTIEDALRN